MAKQIISVGLYEHTPAEISERIKHLKDLDSAVRDWDDEALASRWFMLGVPDGATVYELADIADDNDSFTEILHYFEKLLVEHYSKRTFA